MLTKTKPPEVLPIIGQLVLIYAWRVLFHSFMYSTSKDSTKYENTTRYNNENVEALIRSNTAKYKYRNVSVQYFFQIR